MRASELYSAIAAFGEANRAGVTISDQALRNVPNGAVRNPAMDSMPAGKVRGREPEPGNLRIFPSDRELVPV